MTTKMVRKVRAAMKALGVYKSQFDPVIEIYCQLRIQYDALTERFEASGYDFSEETQTGSKKAPIVTTLESLRKDLLAYAVQLGLTASGLQKLKADALADGKKRTGMDALLSQIDEVRGG